MRLKRALLMLFLLVIMSIVVGADSRLRPRDGEICATSHHDCRRHCRQAELPELLGNVWHHEYCVAPDGDVTTRRSHPHNRTCCWL